MNEAIQNYINGYPTEIQSLFNELRKFLIEQIPYEIEEKLWAKLPSFYVGNNFIRLIPFKDHINIEAAKIMEHKFQLEGYNITPKGMLQIYLNQSVPYDMLQEIFKETLT